MPGNSKYYDSKGACEEILSVCRSPEFMTAVENGVSKLFDTGRGGLRSYRVAGELSYSSNSIRLSFRIAIRGDMCDLIGGRHYECFFDLLRYATSSDPETKQRMVNGLAFDLTMTIALRCLASVSESDKESDIVATGELESWLERDGNTNACLRDVLLDSIETDIPIVTRGLTESHTGVLFGNFDAYGESFLSCVRNEIGTRYKTLILPAREERREHELFVERQSQAEIDEAYNDVETLI